jgi:hypothetical protein
LQDIIKDADKVKTIIKEWNNGQQINRATKGIMPVWLRHYEAAILKGDLVALCGPRNISIPIKEQRVKEGWLGKPKGAPDIMGAWLG